MKRIGFGHVLSVVSGVWFISMGINVIVDTVKKLRN